MHYDIVIRDGTVVDGLGTKPYRADIGIRDGRIAEIGQITAGAAEEIDARDMIVSPGFIDLHTHLDAQIGWDSTLAPLCWHGVTTALMGNCGVTFAPCKPEDRPFLAGIMESVEDIPHQAIMSGLPWTWEHYGEYLDTIEGLKPGINIAGLVGHSALRYYVMGGRSFEDAATDAEISRMADIVAEAMDAGAAGFSINRFPGHMAPDGRAIPGTFAEVAELVEIGKAVTARNGLIQLVGADAELLTTIADETGGRVAYSFGVGAENGAGRQSVQFVEKVAENRDLTALMMIRGTGYMLGLSCSLPFQGDTWDSLRPLSLGERLTAINDSTTATKLISEGNASPPVLPGHGFEVDLQHTYYIGNDETPNLTAPDDQSVRNHTATTGESFVELFLRLARESDGLALFNYRLFCQNLDELGYAFQNSDKILPSLGDSGAHVSQVVDADWATFVLRYWVKERGVFSLVEGIRRMTSAPARIMGLTDRGSIAIGQRADINVFDLDQLTQLQPRIAHDFPGGAPHFTLGARGYKATLVNGVVNVRDDELTGVQAGMLLRPSSVAAA